MIVLDPGHEYLLDSLDGYRENRLVFVKREGDKYPGNAGHHAGTMTQEVLRALIERGRYVNNQTPCDETTAAIQHMVIALVLLEERAARLHGRELSAPLADVITGRGKCAKCGHCGCSGVCRV